MLWPYGIVRTEVDLRSLGAHLRPSDIFHGDSDTGPMFRMRYKPRLDAVGQRIGDLFADGGGAIEFHTTGLGTLKDLFRPTAMALERIGQGPVSFAQERGEVAGYIGKYFMNMGGQHLYCVQFDAELLCHHGSDVPIDLLHCAVRVRAEEKVTSGGAAGDEPGASGNDSSGLGHAIE